MKYLFFFMYVSISASQPYLRYVSAEYATKAIHKALEENNETKLELYLTISKKIKDFDGANCLYEEQCPLHKVKTPQCMKLLLKYNPKISGENSKGQTALLHHMASLTLFHDKYNRTERSILIEKLFHKKEIIKILAEKSSELERKDALTFYAKMLKRYSVKNHLTQKIPGTTDLSSYKEEAKKLLELS